MVPGELFLFFSSLLKKILPDEPICWSNRN